MKPHQASFWQTIKRCDAVQLDGPYRLKSGRTAPYFFDTGRFSTGQTLQAVGRAYAQTIVEIMPDDPPDVIFGPAYKGIPLAVACAMGLAEIIGRDVAWLFDRKEAKPHGEHTRTADARARLVGGPLREGARIVLVDDVLTTAQTKYEACALLRSAAADLDIAGLFIALDRQERDDEGQAAAMRFERTTGVPVHAILTARDLLGAVRADPGVSPKTIEALAAHLDRHGVP